MFQNWKEILPMTQLKGGYKKTRFNHYVIRSKTPWTHIRLNIFPDGGIARLRIYGEAYHKWDLISPTKVNITACDKNFNLPLLLIFLNK